MAYIEVFNEFNKIVEKRRQLKFFIANIDTSNDTKYYGFVGNDTQYGRIAPWYILKEITSTGVFRYFFGNVDYDDAWAIRTNLPYGHAYTFPGFHERYDIR